MLTKLSRTLGAFALAQALCMLAGCGSVVDAMREHAPLDETTEALMQPTRDHGLVLSPDGRNVALITLAADMPPEVFTVDTATNARHMVIGTYPPAWNNEGSFSRRVPVGLSWLDDDTLAVRFHDGSATAYRLDGRPDTNLFAGFYGLYRADGESEMTAIVKVLLKQDRMGRVRLHSTVLEDLTLALPPEERLVDWLTDAHGRMRVVRTTRPTAKDSRVTTWYRTGVGVPWTKVDERSLIDDPFRAVLVADEPGHIVVLARNGGDRFAVWDFDAVHMRFGSVLVADADEDVVGFMADGRGEQFKSFRTAGLLPKTTWIDPRMADLQRRIDAALPGRVTQVLQVAGGKALLRSVSDVEPERAFVVDIASARLMEIPLRSWHLERPAAPMTAVRYPSFDGTQVPAYLTRPVGSSGAGPLVVLIHGGPQARDEWGWNEEVQVLAAHGYSVFQPQFRGSVGFGRRFEEAGYGQWGQAMQDDITAGVRYLIDQGVADPHRVCIVGASYGGYAALWGLAKTPDLYRCGVSVAGVSDIERMLHDDSDTSKNATARELMRERIGDPALMKASWDSVSPLKHADLIRAPVLIIHGGRDERVPISHGLQMAQALKAQHKDVRFIEFAKEAHGIVRTEDRRAYYVALLAFLDRTIGPYR